MTLIHDRITQDQAAQYGKALDEYPNAKDRFDGEKAACYARRKAGLPEASLVMELVSEVYFIGRYIVRRTRNGIEADRNPIFEEVA